ncbi:MAG: hypothetical protein QOF98_1875, partial [Streptomyces sp.]|nr:hypothetical protein [Streptomyces sp.]
MTANEEETALALYQAVRTHGEAVSGPDIRKAAGLDPEQAEAALRRLRRLGLVREDGTLLEPVEPDAALVRTMAAYQAHAAEQVRSASELQQLTDALLTVYRPAVAGEASRVEVEYIIGSQRKERTVNGLNVTVRESFDSMHP